MVDLKQILQNDLNNKQYRPFIEQLKQNGFKQVEGKDWLFTKNGISPEQLYQEYLQPSKSTTVSKSTSQAENVTSIAGEYDVDRENRISDVLKWFLSLYVDIAKDPKISKGNHNIHTANTVFMLVRAGVNYKVINRLVGQYSVRKYVDILNKRISRVAKPDNRRIRDAVIEEMGKDLSVSDEQIKNAKNNKNEYLDFVKKFIDKNGKIDNNTLIASLKKNIDNPTFEKQVVLLDVYIYLNSIGSKFGKTVSSSKQDVNGGGKNFISALVNLNQKNNAVNLGFGNIESKFENTFLGTAFENSVVLSMNVMEQLFITANKSAQNVYNNVARLITNENNLQDVKIGDKIASGYFSFLLGNKAFNLSQLRIAEMFVGENTTYDKVLTARDLMPDNYFLSQLNLVTEKNKKFIKMDNTRNNSPQALNELSRSWKQLIDSDNIFLQKLGNELIFYSFYTSGFKNNISSFFEHIPVTKLSDIVESTILEAKQNFNNSAFPTLQFMDKFFRNNWVDDKIVPLIHNYKIVSQGELKGLLTLEKQNGTETNKHLSPYIKIEFINEADIDAVPRTKVYKKIGSQSTEKSERFYYKEVGKLGYTDNKGNYIFELNNLPVDKPSMFKENTIGGSIYVENIKNAEINFAKKVLEDENFQAYSIEEVLTNDVFSTEVITNTDQDKYLATALQDDLITQKCNNNG